MSITGQFSADAASQSALRVLVLDDDDATRLAIGQYLEHCGHSVALASTVDEAIAQAESTHPQVVVCDWRLSELRDGIDAARLLTKEHDVQIVFVTAHSLVDLKRHFQGIRPARCLRKPISLAELSAAVSAAGATKHH
jgi:CheY-like chemotaxis protein